MTDHWSNNPVFGNQFIKSMMTSDAWFEIYRNLQYDGIHRIKWLTDTIQAAFNKSFAEDIDISEKSDFCMDETLIHYLGWLDFSQYLPDKPHPFGLLVLALAKSRFIVKFELYTGKRGEKRSNQLCDLMYRFMTSINTTGIPKKTFYADNYYYSSFAVCSKNRAPSYYFYEHIHLLIIFLNRSSPDQGLIFHFYILALNIFDRSFSGEFYQIEIVKQIHSSCLFRLLSQSSMLYYGFLSVIFQPSSYIFRNLIIS
ncbi:Transposase_IS4 [Hexamita inflata]|uniref:Transposase_IS4 n=1 Tax=Hexamita inflata TaxID=28002 RepID=A0ABP1K754_9EUKA